MAPTDFSGRDVVKHSRAIAFFIVDRTGSHVKRSDEHPETEDDGRLVTVPMHDRIDIGTLHSIANQSGANDFRKWCTWIDRNR